MPAMSDPSDLLGAPEQRLGQAGFQVTAQDLVERHAEQQKDGGQQSGIPHDEAKAEGAGIHDLVIVADGVTDPTHGSDQFFRIGIIHLAAQMAHIDIHDIGQALKALVPDVFDDHGPRQNSSRVGRQVFQQAVFLGGQFNPLPRAPHFLTRPINLHVAHPEHVRTARRRPGEKAP